MKSKDVFGVEEEDELKSNHFSFFLFFYCYFVLLFLWDDLDLSINRGNMMNLLAVSKAKCHLFNGRGSTTLTMTTGGKLASDLVLKFEIILTIFLSWL